MRRRCDRDPTVRRWGAAAGRLPSLLSLAALCLLPGCAGELGALAALTFGMTMSVWIVGRERQRRVLLEAAGMRRALAGGEHRRVERRLRRELALAAAGETVPEERVWLARAQLAELLIAEWRLDEARQIYDLEEPSLSPHLRALASFGRHELEVLCEVVDDRRIDALRRDRDACIAIVPAPIRGAVERAWGALEGVAAVRSGRAREAIALLERGIDAVAYNPARIIYIFHLAQAYESVGARERALAAYRDTTLSFPGTRLASEAQARIATLSRRGSGFRGMLPEAPSPSRTEQPVV
jgi:tetratricopeptide (TPR) repeat protein